MPNVIIVQFSTYLIEAHAMDPPAPIPSRPPILQKTAQWRGATIKPTHLRMAVDPYAQSLGQVLLEDLDGGIYRELKVRSPEVLHRGTGVTETNVHLLVKPETNASFPLCLSVSQHMR